MRQRERDKQTKNEKDRESKRRKETQRKKETQRRNIRVKQTKNVTDRERDKELKNERDREEQTRQSRYICSSTDEWLEICRMYIRIPFYLSMLICCLSLSIFLLHVMELAIYLYLYISNLRFLY